MAKSQASKSKYGDRDWSKLPAASAEVGWKAFHKLLARTRQNYDADANSVNLRWGGWNEFMLGLGFNPATSADAVVAAFPCHIEPRSGSVALVTGLKSKCPSCNKQLAPTQPRRQMNDSQKWASEMAASVKAAMTTTPTTKTKTKATKTTKRK